MWLPFNTLNKVIGLFYSDKEAKNKQWPFNPLKYRVIGVGQRWCGRSTPFGDTANNTTQLLIEDL
ncbi:MAG: hypothetical protein ACI97K_000570 [Glaciecola sp.]